jgi:hypothetical protein
MKPVPRRGAPVGCGAVCAELGLDPARARLLRNVNNVVFQLARDPVVIRLVTLPSKNTRQPRSPYLIFNYPKIVYDWSADSGLASADEQVSPMPMTLSTPLPSLVCAGDVLQCRLTDDLVASHVRASSTPSGTGNSLHAAMPTVSHHGGTRMSGPAGVLPRRARPLLTANTR